MPTQEERLPALEKLQTVSAAHIRETEENTTILLGVIREYGRDIKRTFQRLEVIDERLDALEGRFGTLEDRFGEQEKKLDQVLLLLTTLTTKPVQETE